MTKLTKLKGTDKKMAVYTGPITEKEISELVTNPASYFKKYGADHSNPNGSYHVHLRIPGNFKIGRKPLVKKECTVIAYTPQVPNPTTGDLIDIGPTVVNVICKYVTG